MVKERITIKKEELTEENEQTRRSHRYQRKECVREKMKGMNIQPNISQREDVGIHDPTAVSLLLFDVLRIALFTCIPIQSSAEISCSIIYSNCSECNLVKYVYNGNV